MKRALLFVGQGSQYVGMMKDLADNYSEARMLLENADSILGYNLSSICFDGPIEKLKETRYTQPALFVHGAILTALIDGRIAYDAVAGHSVGEYAALHAAGVLSFEDALKLVSLRGELMFRAGEHEPGTMFAVIGLADEMVEEICNKLNDPKSGNIVVPANYNSPGQLVVSGSAQYLRDNIAAFKEAGARMTTELVVSGAFHSPLMLPAKEELGKAIDRISFNDARVPIYSNVYAKPLVKAQELKEALILQLTSPVKWTQSLQEMKSNGIDMYTEMGPGQVLQGLIKRSMTDVQYNGIDKAADLEKILNENN